MLLFTLCWCLIDANRVNIGIAWLSGLLIDILQNNTLGEHALIFALSAYCIVKFGARIRFFPFWNQWVVVTVLIWGGHLLRFETQTLLGNLSHNALYWLPALSTTLLWPWTFSLLKGWQRNKKLL
jgi:rod shape-determining protein MreD